MIFPMTYYIMGLFLYAVFLAALGFQWQALLCMLIAPFVGTELEFGIVVFFSLASGILGTVRSSSLK